MATLALYTTVYPGVEAYLADWYRSLRLQTDRDFQLWVGLDTLSVQAAEEAMGGDPDAIWVPAQDGDSPATIRQRALARIIEDHDQVVLVDSDDIMHASRVAAARASLEASDLAGCALRLVNERGESLDMTFKLPADTIPDDVFPDTNAFGLSNTAYRSSLLRQCLPIPADVALVDWYLSTRAWLLGARLAFDAHVAMDYRQHRTNMARVLGPFHEGRVIQDTKLVRQHFRLLGAAPIRGALPHRLAEVEHAAADIEAFYACVVLRPEILARYLRALNELSSPFLWWSWVANPLLRHMWTTGKEVM